MRLLKKIALFPVLVLIAIMSTSLKLIIKAECWVAGVGFLLLAVFAILAAIKCQWMQFGVFLLIVIIGVLSLCLLSVIICWIEDLRKILG